MRTTTRTTRTQPGLALAVSATLLLPALLGALSVRTRRMTQMKDDGASIVEWLLITALVVGAAVAIGAIVVGKFTTKANELDLTTP